MQIPPPLPPPPGLAHKVLTYVEYRAVPGVFQNIGPPPTSPPSECVLPPHQRRGVHTRRAERGGGSIFWKTPAIGLASYSPVSLRFGCSLPRFCSPLNRKALLGCAERKAGDSPGSSKFLFLELSHLKGAIDSLRC